MPTTRKTFLKQAGFALAGSCLPFSELLAKEFAGRSSPTALDTYHPVKCTIDLATYDTPTSYKYSYIEDNDGNPTPDSDINVLPGYYSEGGTPTNPYCNDVVYDAEGDNGGDPSCKVAAADGCNPYDYDKDAAMYIGQNPFRYKAYYPKETIHNYTNTPLPVYILFHAGGFQECTSYDGGQLKQICIELSRKGFICFTCEYRRGRIFDPANSQTNPLTTVQQQLAIYRAIQDGCGAIRSIIKKNRDGDDQKFPFKIKETQVFIGGQSAGAIIALGCAYYQTTSNLTNQSMIDMVFQQMSATGNTIEDVLGNMHSDRYYAPALPTYWPKIAGVASMWGGFVIPKTYDSHEVDFFKLVDPAANPPLIAFHGEDDIVIPFYDDQKQNINLSGNVGYKATNLCTLGNNCPSDITGKTFTQKVLPNNIEYKFCSSLNLYRVMKNPDIDKFCELYVDCSMKHGLDADCPTCADDGSGLPKNPNKNGVCVTCTPYSSSFGTNETDILGTIKYLAARIAVFSHAIMYNTIHNPTTPLTFGALGRSFFKDCENFRKCNQTTENNNCTGADVDKLCNGSSPLVDEITE